MRRPEGLPEALGALDRTLVMGIVNVTPDSFSDGGLWSDPDQAIARGLGLRALGADLVDVGGESTRPGADRIPVREELDRVIPVVSALVSAGVPVSIDTMRAEVAAACVASGACLVNDVSGGAADPDMGPWIAGASVPYVVMHWRGPSRVMARMTSYDDVVADVCAELMSRVDALCGEGVDPRRMILDPGLGFAKESEHNWQLLGRLDVLQGLGFPLLVGASRKRFLGDLLADASGPRPLADRDAAGDAISALAARAGAWAVRVHEVAATRDAVAVAQAWRAAAGEAS
ncbi:MAG: dihydropteroate synthase [bacterium]